MNALCITLLLCLVDIASSQIKKDTEPSLELCKIDVKKDVVTFKCCSDVALTKLTTMELRHGNDVIAGTDSYTNNEKCVTKNVAKANFKTPGSYTCKLKQGGTTTKASKKVDAKGTDCLTSQTTSELKICKKNDKEVNFICDVKQTVRKGSTMILKYNNKEQTFSKGKDKVTGTSVTRTVSKDDYKKVVSKITQFQCQVATGSVHSKSANRSGKVFKELTDCPAKPSSAPRLVNSSAVTVVCVLTTLVKFIY